MRIRKLIGITTIVAVTVGGVVQTSGASAGAPGVQRGSFSISRTQRSATDRSIALRNARIGATMSKVVWSPFGATDPTGDTAPKKYGQADITGVRVATSNEPGVPSLFVSAAVAAWIRPTNSAWQTPALQAPATSVDWLVDANADGFEDFALEISNYLGFVYGDVYNAVSGAHVCNAIPLFDSLAKSYGVYAPLSCLGNPRSVKVYAMSRYSVGTSYAADVAPNAGWVTVASTRAWPNKPGVPTASAAPASIDLSWAAPSASLWPVSDYVVQYSLASPVSWKTFADGVSTARMARVTGLVPGKKYIVRVAAKNRLGTGLYTSASASRTALAAGVLPTAPGRPTGTSGNRRVTVQWSLPAKVGSKPITDYELDVSTNNGVSYTRFADGVSAVRNAVVTGLTPASVIKVRVRAKSFAGVGPWSVASLPLRPFTTPMAPTGLAGTPGSTSLDLSWLAAGDNASGPIDSYRVFYRPTITPRSITVQPRIVGGANSPISATPWQARVSLDGSLECGGSLIDVQWVLTAAHCTYDENDVKYTAGRFTVHVGISDQNDMNALNGFAVDKVFTHPGWSPSSKSNDVALLHLAKPVTLSSNVAVVGLYDQPAGPVATTNAIISGWGTLTSGGSVPAVLQKATVQVLAEPGATGNCASYGAGFIPSTMLCAGVVGGGTDTCQGDSGGPLVVDVLGVPKLAGVTSFGDGCADATFPGIYTRVSTFAPWIQDKIESLWPHLDVSCAGPCLAATIPDLVPAQTYEVKVRAHNAYGFGAATAVQQFTTTP